MGCLSFLFGGSLIGACITSGNLPEYASSGTSVASGNCVASSPAAMTGGASGDEKHVVCNRWACARGGISAATWDGDTNACSPGQMDDTARNRALGLVNAYRFLAGVHEVDSEPRWDTPAQECALLAQANRKLSHTPSRDWSCWTERGARASAVSLIANVSAPLAIAPFIEDPGNESTMVHRRWLLSEKVRRLGFGSTSTQVKPLVDGREFDAPAPGGAAGRGMVDAGTEAGPSVTKAMPRAWVAWPPPGPVPIDAIRGTKVDTTGWTVQSSSLDLDGADVTVRVAGVERPVRVFALERTMGSLTAIRFVPSGWSTEAGKRYEVHVAKDAIDIDFAVEPVTCP
ncbi:MAG TPA: CAP domain-containing protein [Labilithrix sp.]|nr:CAP domain-containing protein [Labilithrix sp.]